VTKIVALDKLKKPIFLLVPSPIFFSSQRSSSLSKFEKAFEAIRKNDRNCKETLKRSSFRKPKRKEGTNEQVDPISNFDFEKEKKRDNLQQH
jgi:hypothetical protein